MDRIGVIVPVYKVEDYISRCVHSVLAQSHRELVLVLVDDGSPDNSGVLCDEFARQDPRIHVIHQENGGLSAARNAALDYLASRKDCQWVTFLDSDDWIHPQMLAWMLCAAQKAATEVCVSRYQETGGEDIWTEDVSSQWETWEPRKFYLQQVVNATIACAKLFSLRCFDAVRFPVGRLHEDEFTTYRILFTQEKIAVMEAPLYAYFVNGQSITRGTWKPKRLDVWDAYEQQLRFFRQRGYEELYRFRLHDYLGNALMQLSKAEETANSEKTLRFIKRRIRNLLRRCWKEGLLNFQYDFTLLVKFYPLSTRLYRFYLEKIKH